jgi:hypothetical protein
VVAVGVSIPCSAGLLFFILGLFSQFSYNVSLLVYVNACDKWINLLIWNALMYALFVAAVMEI